jgi:hypothetical protein
MTSNFTNHCKKKNKLASAASFPVLQVNGHEHLSLVKMCRQKNRFCSLLVGTNQLSTAKQATLFNAFFSIA